MLPIFQAQPGFKAYSLLESDGEILSFSAWESAGSAEAANMAAADWIAKNLADRIQLEETRIGEILMSTTLGVSTKAGAAVSTFGSGPGPPGTGGPWPRRTLVAHAAAEPRHAARRAHRRPARGLVYGNRGCLHDADGPHPPRVRRQALDRLPARVPRLAARAADAARPLHRAVLPRRGDRVRCRTPPLRAVSPRGLRPVQRALARAARRASGADAIDARLHDERLDPRPRSAAHDAALDDLPDGAFVLHDGAPQLVLGDELLRWSPGGYAARAAPGGRAT